MEKELDGAKEIEEYKTECSDLKEKQHLRPKMMMKKLNDFLLMQH